MNKTPVFTKKGNIQTQYSITFIDGELTIYVGDEKGSSFRIGDFAEYDSYNLSYIGKITKITDKTVTIAEQYQPTKIHRLSLETFCWRNFKFNLEKTREENSRTSHYL